jgi:hypothetical protein
MVIHNTALIEEFCFTQKQVVYEELCVLKEELCQHAGVSQDEQEFCITFYINKAPSRSAKSVA